MLNSQGEQASVELHKSYYCSFISKDHVSKLVAEKGNDGSIDSNEIPVARVTSQLKGFDFNKQCLFCVDACKPTYARHQYRWDKVAQRERSSMRMIGVSFMHRWESTFTH